MNEAITIDVVSDVMCPWCYIGKRRLEKALASLPEVATSIHWRPFQLDHTIPERGMDRQEYLKAKFGNGGRADEVYAPIREAGAREDIPFQFERITRSPNTLNAHRVIRWARTAGVQDAVVERLFQLYFIDGADLTDTGVLADCAELAGMERDIIARLLEGDADKAETQEEIAMAQQMGITGVPTFLVGNRYAVIGAREPQVIAGAIAKVLEERETAND
jgi:predicted DsbA family dithiol-disulfide isomerase